MVTARVTAKELGREAEFLGDYKRLVVWDESLQAWRGPSMRERFRWAWHSLKG